MSKHYDDNVNEVAEALWHNYEQTFESLSRVLEKKYGFVLEIDREKKNIFISSFCKRYKFVVDNHMKAGYEALDRHKVAAIAIIEFIRTDIIKGYPSAELVNGNLCIPDCLLALQTGLASMLVRFNKLLKKRDIKPVDKWHMPESLSCPENTFFIIMARNLYFAKRRSDKEYGEYTTGFDELALAERLFYIEWITILKEGIDYTKLQA
ncbi:MAG: hypothetical protein FWD03_02780 [Defluviitaleaceae bacterium]|nr:hypothetical protein [Defluviitaleaceae bacterium]